MRYRSRAAALAAVVAAAGCGDNGTDPGDGGGGDAAAARFEQLADSVDGEGWSPTAEALRHAAKIVRLAGGATPVTLTIDGDDYNLFTKGDGAWSDSKDSTIVGAMKKGKKMEVKGTSWRGTSTTDSYSLAGVKQAMDKIDQQCK